MSKTNTAQEPVGEELQKLFDSFVKKSEKQAWDKENMVGITLWVSREKKQKFDELQILTRRRFGKFLISLLERAMDSVEAPKG